jgi:hypothetical protein
MKTMNLIAAMFLTAVLASTVPASEQVPFRGSLAAVQSGEVVGGFLIVEGSGTGRATELGRFTVTFHEEVDLSTGIGTGTFTFVAANGDTLTSSFIGNATPTPDPNILLLEEVDTITGATGRFAGATGTFTLERVLNLTSGVSTGSFSGTILNRGKR